MNYKSLNDFQDNNQMVWLFKSCCLRYFVLMQICRLTAHAAMALFLVTKHKVTYILIFESGLNSNICELVIR